MFFSFRCLSGLKLLFSAFLFCFHEGSYQGAKGDHMSNNYMYLVTSYRGKRGFSVSLCTNFTDTYIHLYRM
jgi:hypothetical protein